MLGPYFDGELPERKAETVHAHLAICSGCRSEFARLKALQGLLREGFAASTEGESSDLNRLAMRIREEIDRSEREERKGSWKPAWPHPVFRWSRIAVPVAVTGALVAAVIFTIYKPSPPVIKTVNTNDCVVEDIESGQGTVLLFTTHGSDMTVIWVSQSPDV